MDMSRNNQDFTETERTILLVHGLFFMALFGIVIDTLLLNIVFFRQKIHYMRSHMCHGNSLLILYIANQILIYVTGFKYFTHNYLLYIEILLFIFLALQFGLGLSIYIDINQTLLFFDARYKKRFHMLNASFIYILGKLKILFLVYFFLYDWSVGVFWVVLICYCFLIGLAYFLFFLYYKKKTDLNKLVLLKNLKQRQFYSDLKEAIQHKEFVANRSGLSMNFLEASVCHKRKFHKPDCMSLKNSDVFGSIKWAIYEDRIFEIRDLPHSAGKFIISWCHQKDITKYIYGESTLILKDSRSKKYSFLKYQHSFFFRHYVNKNCIGFLKSNGKFELNDSIVECKFGKLETINLYSEETIQDRKVVQEKRVTPYDYGFKLTNSILLGKKWGIHFIEKVQSAENPIQSIDLNVYWVNLLGKYAIFDFPDGFFYFVQPVYFLNPSYLKIRTSRLIELHPELYLTHLERKTFDYDFMLFYEDMNQRSLSSYLIAVGHIDEHKRLTNFNVKWGLGVNLGFSESSFHQFVVILEDEGVFPFVDFLEVIFQRMLLFSKKEANIENDDFWIFSRNCKLSFSNGLQLQFIVFCSPGFLSTMHFLGFYHLHLVLAAQKLANELVVSSVTIISSEIPSEDYPLFNIIHPNFDNIEDLLRLNATGFDRIIVSGGDSLKKRLFQNSKMEDSDYERILFL